MKNRQLKEILRQGRERYDEIAIELPTQAEYRIGDMVLKSFWRRYGFGGVDRKTGEELTGEEYHLKYHPHSIASEYMRRTDESKDFDLLVDIIRGRQSRRVAPKTLIVHLRVGDVIDDPAWNDDSVKTLLLEGSPYVSGLAEIDAMLRCARRHKVERVEILYGFHQKGSFPKSRIYLASVCAFCEMQGFHGVDLVTHASADETLTYVSTAALFARSGGGFSELLSKVVKANGGKVCRRPSQAHRRMTLEA